MIKICRLKEVQECELGKIMDRSNVDISEAKQVAIVIIDSVRANGDKALIEYTRKFDNPGFTDLKVSKKDIRDAYEGTNDKTIEMIRRQIRLSRLFHSEQRSKIVDWEKEIEPGITAGEKWTAIEEVGLYMPGGKNPFPTVAQILAIAATTAGCKRIVACISPRGKNYEVLIALNECRISEIYRCSGAQAIAAMAYGTETIKPVQLIAGPGNPYVTAAKILCQEKVAIDMQAGPSEAVIIADETANPVYCAADILARAEHGPDSAAVLVTTSKEVAEETTKELQRQFDLCSRQEYIKTALERYCAIIITDTIDEAIDFTNQYAPEHLEVLTKDPKAVLARIRNAGSVFLGNYNPVAVGDYASGINHVLPTGGWARMKSAVSVYTFMKRVQFSEVSKKALEKLQPIVDCIADVEGLDAHRRSVDIRLGDKND